jgi:hypothetical protein
MISSVGKNGVISANALRLSKVDIRISFSLTQYLRQKIG